MKRLMTVLVAVAALACVANLANAGDYHVGRLLVCSDCHIAHGSQTHGYATNDTTILGEAGGGHAKLLRGETYSNACLSCHDGKGADGIPDVLGETAQTGIPNGRSAGALNVPTAGAHGKTNDAGYAQSMGHTIWSQDPAPGSTGAVPVSAEGLECSDCHRVHGNKYFRNLNGDVATSTSTFLNPLWFGKEVTYTLGTANIGSPNTSFWVVEKNGAHNYDNDNVQYLEPVDTRSAYGEWCMTCHTTFHGNPLSGNITRGGEVVRHPTAGVDLTTPTSWSGVTALHRLKVMDNTAQWSSASPTITPSCFTCHKSHGNQNRFGLIFVLPSGDSGPSAAIPAGTTIDPRLNVPPRNALMTEEGDGGQYRDMCKNCHGMGRWPTGNPTNLQ